MSPCISKRSDLVSVARDLLLVRGTSAVLVAHRIDVLVRVDPAGLAVGVPQRDLRPVGDLLRLALHDGAEAAFQRGLEQLCTVIIGYCDKFVEKLSIFFSQISLQQRTNSWDRVVFGLSV